MLAAKTFIKFFLRLLVVWFIDTLSLFLTASVVSGVSITSVEGISQWGVAAAAALVLGVVNLLIRPIILMLSIPLGFIVVFIVGFFVNAITLMITSSLIDGFTVAGFWAAVLGGIILSFINTIIANVLSVDDTDSFYQGVVERLAARTRYDLDEHPGPGLLMMEIDGLSYWHLQRAIERGRLPTFKRLMSQYGYELSRADCGLPSQTSACQAGIMFGDNDDIPAFRWYDKDKQKLYVSSSDSAELNARYAHGQGLMRGGASINNMFTGDARHSLLTLADLLPTDEAERAQRARDIYLLLLNPYFLMRVLVLFLWEALVEVVQYAKAVITNVQPRLNRLHKGYPFLRAATTVFMRDVSGYLTALEVIRGAPAIYVTWPGYDEVAHHSGPWSPEAFAVLQRYDEVIASMLDIIERKAPRPYNLVILSDHGQSFGATFKQRYGYDLEQFIRGLIPEHATVHAIMGGDEGSISLRAMTAELENMQAHGEAGVVGQKMVDGAHSVLRSATDALPDAPEAPLDANITVCGSGNLAQVYFDVLPRKITLTELENAYPGLVTAMVQHEGIGLVVGYNDAGQPVAMGKSGVRNLHTGVITGQDPMSMFGDPDLRAAQMRRIADFPHAGDLIVNSTVYEDGTVAAMEELIGNHGGIGGEQTDAFIFHPPNMTFSPTTNAIDVYHLLNTYREEAPAAIAVGAPQPAAADPWALATLKAGFAFSRGWVGMILRAMTLDTGAYRQIAADPYMTGPALFVLLLGVLMGGIIGGRIYDWQHLAGEILNAILLMIILHFAGRLLGGKGSFDAVFRTVSFAYATRFYNLLLFIPFMADFGRFIILVVTTLALWIAGVQAHKLRGWRSLLFPVAALAVFAISIWAVQVLLMGAVFTWQSLFEGYGIAHLR